MKWAIHYRKEIVRMIKEISNVKDLEMVYGMVLAACKDAKKGGVI